MITAPVTAQQGELDLMSAPRDDQAATEGGLNTLSLSLAVNQHQTRYEKGILQPEFPRQGLISIREAFKKNQFFCDKKKI